jgi:hypothetical protein
METGQKEREREKYLRVTLLAVQVQLIVSA